MSTDDRLDLLAEQVVEAVNGEVHPPLVTAPTPASDGPMRLVSLLGDVYTEQGVWIWLKSKNANLCGQRPIDLLASGQFAGVLREADRISDRPDAQPPPPRQDEVALDGPTLERILEDCAAVFLTDEGMQGQLVRYGVQVHKEIQLKAARPAPESTAEVLVSLRAEMTAQWRSARGSRDHVRNTWDEAIALVEAAEQRLAEGRER